MLVLKYKYYYYYSQSKIRTLNRVGFSRVGDAVRVEEPVFSLQHVVYHLLHCVFVKLLLCGLRAKDLSMEEKTVIYIYIYKNKYVMQNYHIICTMNTQF